MYVMQMNQQWMYNTDRCSLEFMRGMHDFLNVAKANTRNVFICFPCVLCKNEKVYSCSRKIHEHLFTSGFMPNYICWTKHGERGVIMEEDEEGEEGDDDNMIIRGFPEYGAFDDTAMEETEEEAAAKEEVVAEDELDDDLGQAICDAHRECKSDKEKIKFERILEDHKKLLYPTAEAGKKVGYHT
jgi:ribosomal protein L24E